MDVMFETMAPPDIGFWELNIQQKVKIRTGMIVLGITQSLQLAVLAFRVGRLG